MTRSRIRTVKPALFQHEKLFELEEQTGLPIRVAWMGLFTVCDREGRFEWRPRRMKLFILPYDQLDFEKVLDALCEAGLVQKYEAEGRTYGCIPTWGSHQKPPPREPKSEIPPPPASTEPAPPQPCSAQANALQEQCNDSAEAVQMQCCDSAVAGGEGEGEREEIHSAVADGGPPELPSDEDPAWKRFDELWREFEVSLKARKISEWNDKRKRAARARWREHPREEYWRWALERAVRSRFCRGGVDPPPGRPRFQANIDWFLRPGTAVKIHEGFYDNKRSHLAVAEQQAEMEELREDS